MGEGGGRSASAARSQTFTSSAMARSGPQLEVERALALFLLAGIGEGRMSSRHLEPARGAPRLVVTLDLSSGELSTL